MLGNICCRTTTNIKHATRINFNNIRGAGVINNLRATRIDMRIFCRWLTIQRLSSAFNRRVQRTALIYSLLTAIFNGGCFYCALFNILSTTIYGCVRCQTSLRDVLRARLIYRCTVDMPLSCYSLAATINDCSIRSPPLYAWSTALNCRVIAGTTFMNILIATFDYRASRNSSVLNWLSASINGCIISLPVNIGIDWY